MFIKDLEISKELSGKELSAVRGGGIQSANQFGSLQLVGGSLVSIGSPNVQANPQTLTQTMTDVNVATVVASANVGLFQIS